MSLSYDDSVSPQHPKRMDEHNVHNNGDSNKNEHDNDVLGEQTEQGKHGNQDEDLKRKISQTEIDIDRPSKKTKENDEGEVSGVPSRAQLEDEEIADSNAQHESGDEPGGRHPCPYCSQTYTRAHNLKSHMLTHSQEKPFTCSICSSKFRRQHDLKRHAKLHTGEKPYTCESCGRKFARGDALVRHMKSSVSCSNEDNSNNNKNDHKIGGEESGNGRQRHQSFQFSGSNSGNAPPNLLGGNMTCHKQEMNESGHQAQPLQKDIYRSESGFNSVMTDSRSRGLVDSRYLPILRPSGDQNESNTSSSPTPPQGLSHNNLSPTMGAGTTTATTLPSNCETHNYQTLHVLGSNSTNGQEMANHISQTSGKPKTSMVDTLSLPLPIGSNRYSSTNPISETKPVIDDDPWAIVRMMEARIRVLEDRLYVAENRLSLVESKLR